MSRFELVIAVFLLGAVACGGSSRSPVVRDGPPPAAPTDGHRHLHRGMTLTYDAGLGVYRVGSLEDHFFHEGLFYRFFQGSWYAAPHVIGPWQPTQASALPEALRRSVGE